MKVIFYLFVNRVFWVCFLGLFFFVNANEKNPTSEIGKYYFNWYKKADFLIKKKDGIGFKGLSLEDNLNSQTLNQNQYSLNYYGYKTVVLGIGNQEKFDLNQSLNLNIIGQISEDIYIKAHLSDQEVPLQPEGYAITLKEIDQVFIEVYSSKYGVLLGHHFINFGEKYFEKINRKVEGLQVYLKWNVISQRGGVALSEGLYHSYSFMGKDGKQTHYFLSGKNNKSFISVFSETERLWKNGVLLKRNQDYLIHYGEGRIDFLQDLLVSPQDVFLVEFQYTLQDYPNTLFYNTVEDTVGLFQWRIKGVLSVDDLNPISRFVLNQEDINKLKKVGDSVEGLINHDSVNITVPQKKGFYAFDLKLKDNNKQTKQKTEFKTSFYLSDKDDNIISKLDDHNNVGFGLDSDLEYQLGERVPNGGWGFWSFKTEINYRSLYYQAFNPIVENHLFVETWNLKSSFLENNYYQQFLNFSNSLTSYLRLGLISGYFSGEQKENGKVESYLVSPYIELGRNKEFKSQFFSTQNHVFSEGDKLKLDYYRTETHLFWNSFVISPKFNWIYELSLEDEKIFNIENDFMTSIILFEYWKIGNWNLQAHYFNEKFKNLGKLRDSLTEVSVSNYLKLNHIGIWSTEILTSFQKIRSYNNVMKTIENSKFILLDWKNYFSDYKQGYALNTNYKLNPTENTTLRPLFIRVSQGTGEYVCDTSQVLIISQHCVLADEKGGDFRLDGFQRDSLDQNLDQKIVDVSFLGDFSLNQRWFTNRNWGSFFHFFSFSFNFDLRHKGKSQQFFYPLFTNKTMNKQLEGKRLLNSIFLWSNSKIERTVRLEWYDLYKFSSFNLTKTSLFKQNLFFSERIYDFWNVSLSHNFSRQKFIFFLSEITIEKFNRLWASQIDITFLFSKIWTWKPSFVYDISKGSERDETYRLLSYVFKNRLERLIGDKNKLSLEYSAYLRTGRGLQSILNGSLGFSKGLTQRLKVIFDFDVNQYFTGSAQYLLREDPNQEDLIQRFFLEGKAFF